jgi:capsular exopolysaccharide synthesis family protein
VAAPNPEIAYRIILSIMGNYTSVTSHVYENVILDVLEAPSIPMYPDNPQDIKRIMKISLWVGAAFMAMVLGLLSMFRDNIKNEEDINRKLDIKSFGVVYHENKYKTIRSRMQKRKKSILITSPTVSFSFVESIKKIRAKFEYKASLNHGNVLLVTSVLENEGKSTIAANLALSLVQKSKKVLLIDADFSKPSIYKILSKEVEEQQDLGAYIQDKTKLEDILMVDENTGLFLMLCGRTYKNSTDLVMRETFKELISITKEVMDYIIIDSPPISASADTELLSDIADASFLVVKQSFAKAKMINDAIDTLSEARAKVLGAIYNNVHDNAFGKSKLGYGHKYSHKNYYGYYSVNAVHND